MGGVSWAVLIANTMKCIINTLLLDYLSLEPSGNQQNENNIVQNPSRNGQNQQVEDGNDRNLQPAAQAADDDNNMTNSNPEVPDVGGKSEGSRECPWLESR